MRLTAICRLWASGPGETFLLSEPPDPEAGSCDGRITYPGRAGCFPADLLLCIIVQGDSRGFTVLGVKQMVIYFFLVALPDPDVGTGDL